MKTRNIFKVVGAILIFSLVSCDTSYFDDAEIGDPIFNVKLKSVPIGTATYTGSEVFKELDETITSGDDTPGTPVTFIYKDTLQSLDNQEIIDIEDDVFAQKIIPLDPNKNNPVIPIGPRGDGLPREFSDKYDEELNDTQANLTSIEFSSGKLEIDLSTDIPVEDATVTVKMIFQSFLNPDGITHPEVEFTPTKQIIQGRDTIIDSGEIDLSNVTLDLTQREEPGDNFNNTVTDVNVSILIKDGKTISNKSVVNYSFKFLGAEVKEAKGDFLKKQFNVSKETVNIGFFKDFENSTVEFSEPTIKLTAKNSFGFPIGISLDKISSNGENVSQLNITPPTTIGEEINGIILNNITPQNNIPYGFIEEKQSGETSSKESTITIDNTNSDNLSDFLNDQPSQIIFDIEGLVNPKTKSPTINSNIFNTTDSLSVIMELQIPLTDVKFENIIFSDVQENELKEDEDEDEIFESGLIKLKYTATNSIPLSGDVTLEFLDNSTNPAMIVETVEAISNDNPTGNSFEAATNGTVTVTTGTIEVSKAQYDNIKDADDLKYNFTLNTPTGEQATINNDDKIVFELYAELDVKINAGDSDNE